MFQIDVYGPQASQIEPFCWPRKSYLSTVCTRGLVCLLVKIVDVAFLVLTECEVLWYQIRMQYIAIVTKYTHLRYDCTMRVQHCAL
jgi:hypothetical protein